MNFESIKEMEKAVLIDPKNPRFRSLSLSCANIGEYEKALYYTAAHYAILGDRNGCIRV